MTGIPPANSFAVSFAPEGKQQPPASEAAILELIDSLFPSSTAHVPLGRGDDCAELHGVKGPLALSTDMFWQDTHFRTAYFTPAEAGAKALATAVSDLAAAGARPLGFSLGLLLPPDITLPVLAGMLSGMAAKARAWDMALSGGDLARGDRIGFSLTVWGAPLSGAPLLRRQRPKAGDALFLIGRAGLARVGLWALERSGRAALPRWPLSCAAHLAPEPLLAEGLLLARLVRTLTEGGQEARLSLMDLSDGLVRDLPRLLGGQGADLDPAPDLIAQEVIAAAPYLKTDPESLFLLGGEDYALLGSCPEDMLPALAAAVPDARLLGRVRERAGLYLRGKRIDLHGFDHFAPAVGRSSEQGEETHPADKNLRINAQSSAPDPDGPRDAVADKPCGAAPDTPRPPAAPPAGSAAAATLREETPLPGPAEAAPLSGSAEAASLRLEAPLPGPAEGAPLPGSAKAAPLRLEAPLPGSAEGAPQPGPAEAAPLQREAPLPDPAEAATRLTAGCREAWQAGLMAGFNGNASCRVSLPAAALEPLPDREDGPKASPPPAHSSGGCLITRAGAAKSRLTRQDFTLLALPGGDPLAGPAASSESAVHVRIYALCPRARVVLHTHPPHLLALGLLLPPEKRLDLPLPEAAAYGARIAWVPFHPPGSRELAEAVAQAALTRPAIWMERHGLVAHGPDPAFVLALTEELEQLARVRLAVLSQGKDSR